MSRQNSRDVSSLEVTLNGSQIEIDPIGNGTRPFDDVKVLLVKGQDGVGSPYTDTPSMDGTGDAGSSALYSRGDHVHPSDTSRQPVTLETPITINGTEQTTVEGALGTIPTAMFKGSDYVTAGRAAGTTAGDRSTAEGSGVTSSAQYTHAEGLQTAATYKAAHAEGEDSTASGRDAHAEGRGTTASNAQAHAEGLNTTAGHTAAHAEGNTTQTGNNYQHVQGKYNVGKSTTAFEVGNGTANNARANALELDWDGNLTVAGTIKDSSGISLSDCQLMALSSAITIGGTEQTTVEGALNGLNDTKVNDDDSRLTDSRNLYNATPTSDSTVYLRRQTTGGMCAIKKIVGGSVVKNQLAYNGNFNGTSSGWLAIRATLAVSSNVLTATCSTAGFVTVFTDATYGAFDDVINHKVLVRFKIKPSITGTFKFALSDNSINTNTTEFSVSDTSDWTQVSVVTNPTSSGATGIRIANTLAVGDTIQLKEINIIDLTQMFGNTIADYIYTLERATAGSGIAKLAEWGFDLSVYHAYDAGSLQSVKLAGKKALDSDNNEIGFTPMSPTDLRGIYSLDASNNLISDGDEYYPDGGENVKYWIVDLGSLSWTKHATQEKFYSYISGDIKGKYTGQGYGLRNAICSGYQNTDVSYSSMNDKEISIGSNFTGASNCSVVVRDDTKYASMTAAQFKTAVTGIYVIYPLNTAQTAQVSSYQSIESISNDGTEEYIDYGVQQGTRDLAIPPYSSAEYTVGNADNVIASGDVIDGYNNVLREKENHRDLISLLGDDESGRTTASRAYSVNEFFYKDGAVFKVTASIASGAAFTVGTNCTQTTIFAVLTALLNA